MSLKSRLGLDGFDLAIQAGVTAVLLFWIVEVNRHEDAVIWGSLVTCASLILLAVRRSRALRSGSHPGLTTGEMAAERLAELEERLAGLEAVEAQVAELSERLDFAERLLARVPPEQRPLLAESDR